MTRSDAERIAALETEVTNLKEEVREMNRKLDNLLALKNKGAGAFWLGGILFGTSLAAFLTYVLSWFRS